MILPISITQNISFLYRALHLNIHSLPSKYDQLDNLLSRIGINLDFIMLCETFLNNINYDKFNNPGYNFAQSHRKNCRGGGVGIYISTKYQFTLRDDIAINVESEFESIFVEINDTSQ